MLEFLLGRACTGKSYDIINRAAIASKNGPVVIIVPEQFSFETERAVVKNNNSVVENISVLSFSRLYDDVISKSGRGYYPFVSDFEKVILMKKALGSVAENLKMFSRFTGNRDFLFSLLDEIKNLKFSGVSAEELSVAADKIGGTCGAKLQDISLVMSTYESLLGNKFIDPSDKLTKLYHILNDFKYFENKTIFFDSFTGFTGQQYKIIEKAIEQAQDTVFSFCTDDPQDKSLGVFHNINFAVTKITEIARRRGVTENNVTVKNKGFYSNNEMAHLEILMAGKDIKNTIPSNKNINIISCENHREEALAAANIISNEVRKNGYRFKDFILVARDAETYGNYVEKQCKLNDLSCFMDKSNPLTSTPLYIYILNLLNVAESATTDNILKLLKLDLTEISPEKISELEDYTYVWNVGAADWKNNWTMSVRGLQTEEDNEYDLQRLAQINETRQAVYNIISRFRSEYIGSPKDRAKAVYYHLTQNGIDRNLSKICSAFEDEGNNYYSSVLKQSWDLVMNIFDSLVRVLEDNEISAEDFKESFIIAAQATKISNIPQMLDEITFGAADRIRPSKPKISIIMGANQGVFPLVSSKIGLLAPGDKSKLLNYGINIDDDAVKGAIEENYLVYSMLCCPVDKVYILYSKRNAKGEELEPSTFISKIQGGFSDISIQNFSFKSYGEFAPKTPKSAFSQIGNIDKSSYLEVKQSLKEYDEYNNKLYKLDNLSKEASFSINPQDSLALFGNELHISATKFDTYHKCKLSYLLKSGFRVSKLQKADLNVLQRGTIAHYVLETIVNKYHGGLAQLSPIQISAEVDSIIHNYMSAVRGSQALMTSRFAYLLEKISASVKEIVYHIAQEFAQCDFEPMFCELTVGKDGDIPRMEYVLTDGSKAYFDGKIDRVDVYKNNVRVVDYKTGKMTFALSDTLVGLNMQMLLYLYAFTKNGGLLVEDPQPAGILYMPAKHSRDTKSLKMNGLISNDDEIRNAMESDNKGVYVPKYSDSSDSYVDKEMFTSIFSKIDELMLNMGDSVRQGDFSANPTDGVNTKACAYCDFASICRSKNIKHNSVESLSNSEIAEILKGGDRCGI